eukprot:CAMPEP_0206583396 /NCGR_PEP_ID=MMETSP0325_2-20121206/35079_1 /ASSEMBLY_ACC=CAM_ASM_000347 /TAXON_ID=2866 /ORGANISM="Crypthecodinium cohnii, Strain Seligo" /LENGTH=61 /DNA_ID=CAMNT_0054090309 /DNA_START=153 /DNA_END=338 /DNA_ORIENTATION=-
MATTTQMATSPGTDWDLQATFNSINQDLIGDLKIVIFVNDMKTVIILIGDLKIVIFIGVVI